MASAMGFLRNGRSEHCFSSRDSSKTAVRYSVMVALYALALALSAATDMKPHGHVQGTKELRGADVGIGGLRQFLPEGPLPGVPSVGVLQPLRPGWLCHIQKQGERRDIHFPLLPKQKGGILMERKTMRLRNIRSAEKKAQAEEKAGIM